MPKGNEFEELRRMFERDTLPSLIDQRRGDIEFYQMDFGGGRDPICDEAIALAEADIARWKSRLAQLEEEGE